MAALTWIVALVAGVACVNALGTEVSIEEHPSVVQIEDRVAVLWLQQCAGVIVTNYHILSTAGCFNSDAERRVRAGSSERGVGGQVLEIDSLHHHPSFGALHKDGDLTIARLAASLVWGAGVAQGAIIGQGVDLPNNYPLTIVGWGTTSEGGLFGDNKLYELSLININNDECLEKYLIHNGETVTENMVCAGLSGTRGRDLDSRDAGTPIFIRDGVSTTVVGVVSFGVSRNDDALPIVSTSIASYTSWIVDTVTATVP